MFTIDKFPIKAKETNGIIVRIDIEMRRDELMTLCWCWVSEIYNECEEKYEGSSIQFAVACDR